MHTRLPPRDGQSPTPTPPRAPEPLKLAPGSGVSHPLRYGPNRSKPRRTDFYRLVGALSAASLLILLPGLGSAYSTWKPAVSLEGYTAREISLPNFNSLSGYVWNYHGAQYPVLDYTGKYADCLVYIDNSSRFAYYCPLTNSTGEISSPVTLLYQQTPGPGAIQAQIDNEFQLDTPSDVALLYGNLTTTPSHVTLEAAFLSNGTVAEVTTPVFMDNYVQADYIGNGQAVLFNESGSTAKEAYFVDFFNDSSWPAGQTVGYAPNNIYWVAQLDSFIDQQGDFVTQWPVAGDGLVHGIVLWFNSSLFSTVYGVNGIAYDGVTGQLAISDEVDLSAGGQAPYDEILNAATGKIQAKGSYADFGTHWFAEQRYVYTTPLLWTTTGNVYGPTALYDPFTNATAVGPNVVGRQESSGGNSNYELGIPTSDGAYVSLNSTLVGATSLAPNQFVWVYSADPPTVSSGGSGGSSPGVSQLLGVPLYYWIAGGLVVGAVLIAVAARRGDL